MHATPKLRIRAAVAKCFIVTLFELDFCFMIPPLICPSFLRIAFQGCSYTRPSAHARKLRMRRLRDCRCGEQAACGKADDDRFHASSIESTTGGVYTARDMRSIPSRSFSNHWHLTSQPIE